MRINYLSESAHNEWYTPPHLVAACREALGGEIVFDPFSCEVANSIVQARHYFTKEDNALLQDWPSGPLFANPPYERKLIDQCISRLVRHHLDTSAPMCVLVNVASDTKWFAQLSITATAVAFLHKRVEFIDAYGKPSKGNTRAQAIFYYGSSPRIFAKIMAPYGYTMTKHGGMNE